MLCPLTDGGTTCRFPAPAYVFYSVKTQPTRYNPSHGHSKIFTSFLLPKLSFFIFFPLSLQRFNVFGSRLSPINIQIPMRIISQLYLFSSNLSPPIHLSLSRCVKFVPYCITKLYLYLSLFSVGSSSTHPTSLPPSPSPSLPSLLSCLVYLLSCLCKGL